MELKLLSTTVVKPETRVRSVIPLTIFDKASPDLHVASLLVFNTATATNTKLKEALAKALTLYPILAGKLSDDYRAVYLDDDSGVPLFETEVSGNLADFLLTEPSPALTFLHPQPESANPLLLIQLNRFDCGGLVLGFCANHKVADGQSMSNFIISWSQLVRDQPVKVQPVFDRSLLVARNPPKPEYPHEEGEFRSSPTGGEPNIVEGPIKNLVVHYSTDFIKKLKERAGPKHSTFECLFAHIWRKAAIALGLGDEEVTSARVSINGRPKLGTTHAYFGNLVLTAFPKAKVKDLVQGDLECSAKLIKEAVREIGHGYFQSFVDFGAVNEDKDFVPKPSVEGNTMSPHLEVDSWLGFEFHQVDMGGGGPYMLIPSWIPVEGIIIITPAPYKEKEQEGEKWPGGINVILCLSHDHAMTFNQISHSID